MQLAATQRYAPTTVYWKLRILVVHATYKGTLAVTFSPKVYVRCNKFCDHMFGQKRQSYGQWWSQCGQVTEYFCQASKVSFMHSSFVGCFW